jgi:folate-dependent phosphoribosylglycinamide formyltransferase PurN
MKIAIITAGDAIDRFLIGRLKENFESVSTIKFEDRTTKTATGPKDIRGYLSHYKYFVRGKILDRVEKDIDDYCQKDLCPPNIEFSKVLPAKEINTSAFASYLQSLSLDYLVLLGAPVLKPQIFSVPKVSSINVHYGVAPRYRGSYTLFWAEYFNDHSGFGATIHEVDSGVDTGQVLSYVLPKTHPCDTEKTLTAKCARLSADELIEIIRGRRRGLSNSNLATGGMQGKTYRYKDRRIRHEVIIRMKRWYRQVSFTIKQRRTREFNQHSLIGPR